MKLPLGDLNLGHYPPHPTSTYTCEMTIAPRVCSGNTKFVYVKGKKILNFRSSPFKFKMKFVN